MKPYALMLAAVVGLSACSGDGTNPFDPDEPTTGDPGTSDPGTDTPGIDRDGTLPPGTSEPTPATGIVRSEPRADSADDATYGNGFANSIAYDGDSDTFFVDGLAFDGSQPDGAPYARSVPSNLRSYALYEGPSTHPDFLTKTPIAQMQHRALYGVSTSGDTEFAIVRTGSYIEYGFGGFIYQRDGGVVLPEEGQATYSGDYAGLRDFNGRGGDRVGLEYVTGDMRVDIDFEGFRNNCSGATCADAIRGVVSNRQFFDMDGNETTGGYLTALTDEGGNNTVPLTKVPTIRFSIGPNVMDANGEATGDAYSTVTYVDSTDGSVESSQLDGGNYYILLSGDHTEDPGGEIAGVVVVESDDPRGDNITVRETGGFILER